MSWKSAWPTWMCDVGDLDAAIAAKVAALRERELAAAAPRTRSSNPKRKAKRPDFTKWWVHAELPTPRRPLGAGRANQAIRVKPKVTLIS